MYIRSFRVSLEYLIVGGVHVADFGAVPHILPSWSKSWSFRLLFPFGQSDRVRKGTPKQILNPGSQAALVAIPRGEQALKILFLDVFRFFYK